jgi:coenzyme F420 biosynthesis associated uncharacterized protein
MDVDWGLAARIAKAASGEAPVSEPPATLEERANAAREQVVEATGLVPIGPLPPAEWIDRAAWIDANIATMRSTVGPALKAAGGKAGNNPAAHAMQAAAGALVAAEIGGLLGMFSRRVLGQYELNLTEPDAPTRLLLVGPNLDRAVAQLDADRDELVTWVTLHEVTHAVQFGAVPWLRPRLGDALQELLKVMDVKADPRALLRLGIDDLKALAGSVREGGLLGAVIGEDRKALLDQVQGTMGLVEGHAEWTMDRAGGKVLKDVDGLREAMDRRRGDRAPLLRILDRLLGFDLKLKQYQQGREFCDAVVGARGDQGLTDAWAAPELAPTSSELGDPAAWLARTAPAADAA